MGDWNLFMNASAFAFYLGVRGLADQADEVAPV